MRFLPLLLVALLLPLGAFAAKCSDPGPQCLVAASICCEFPGDDVPSCATQSQCENQNGNVVGVPGENGVVANAQTDTATANQENTSANQTNTQTDNSNSNSDTAFPTEEDSSVGGSGTGGGALMNPLNASTIEGLLEVVLDAVVTLGTIALVLMLVYVGYLFVAAQGNPKKIEDARAALMWTVVGGLVLLGASGLSLVIKSTVEAL